MDMLIDEFSKTIHTPPHMLSIIKKSCKTINKVGITTNVWIQGHNLKKDVK